MHAGAFLALLLFAGIGAAQGPTPQDDPTAAARQALVRTIERHAAGGFPDDDTLDPRVLQAMGRVPRHRFVPEEVVDRAYDDRPLPIGHGQTISQPYIVALMTHLLRPEPDDVMLEVGTGSGYQAAVLSGLVERVYTLEIVEPLGRSAAQRLSSLGYRNVEARVADGWNGWPEHGPFDGIVVTAAASQIPPPLVRQLKPGGRMVIPVGPPFVTQTLVLVEKAPDGTVRSREILPVRFVPLTAAR